MNTTLQTATFGAGCFWHVQAAFDTLDGVVETGRSPAETLLEAYHGRWGESVDPVFEEFAY